MPDLDDVIGGIFGEDETYPGSKRKRRDPPPPKENRSLYGEDPWDAKPKVLTLAGGIGERELFTIGNLAQAINRRPVTIRSWEAKGILPKARIRDKQQRRLYTRKQVQGLIRLCEKHGILDFDVRPDGIPPGFAEDVLLLWKEPL